MKIHENLKKMRENHVKIKPRGGKCGSRRGTGSPDPPPPPGKSQVICASIREQLDPRPGKVGPPPLKMLDPPLEP